MTPLRLTDEQLAFIMATATPLSPDKRAVLLERTAAHLARLGYLHVTDADLDDAVRLALRGLRHAPAAQRHALAPVGEKARNPDAPGR
jgi:hypothetical protein